MNFFFIYNLSDGSHYSHYLGLAEEWTNIPDGCGVIGPIPSTESIVGDIFQYPHRYIVKDGQLVYSYTDEQLLAEKQLLKPIELGLAYENALDTGFQVTLGANTYTLGWAENDRVNMNLTQTAIDRGNQTFPIWYSDINGNPFQIQSQTDLNAIEAAATNFYVAMHQQIQELKAQVLSATLDTIDTITWPIKADTTTTMPPSGTSGTTP